MSPSQTRIRSPRRTGLTVVEVLISTFLVGVVVAAALNASTSVIRARMLLGEGARARLLAHDLLAEISELPFRDLDGGMGLGVEADEDVTTRIEFDDVDDYHGWTSSPPTSKDGSPLAGFNDWQRKVTIEYVDPDELDRVVTGNLGVKRVTVLVMRAESDLATQMTIVTGPAG